MNDKVLESVIEITEQKNSLALSYSILATLSELLPLSSATLFHHLGRATVMVARLNISKDPTGAKQYQWQYDQVHCYENLCDEGKIANAQRSASDDVELF